VLYEWGASRTGRGHDGNGRPQRSNAKHSVLSIEERASKLPKEVADIVTQTQREGRPVGGQGVGGAGCGGCGGGRGGRGGGGGAVVELIKKKKEKTTYN